MRQKLVLFVSGIPFFNYRDYIVNKSQTIDCLPMMFLRVRSVTQTNILVGIRRLLLLWHKKLFCRSVCLSLLWKPMWITATFGKFTNNATLTMRNMFVGSYYYLFGKSILPRRPRGGQLREEKWRRKLSRRGERTPGMLLLTNQFHDLFE